MASRLLRTRLRNTWRSWPSSASTGGVSGAKSRTTSTPARSSSSREKSSTPPSTAVTSSGTSVGLGGRAMRRYCSVTSVSRSTSRVTAASSSRASRPSSGVRKVARSSASSSISTLRPMEDRGLRTSWAICAEMRPTAASCSARASASAWALSWDSRAWSERAIASNSRASTATSSSPCTPSWARVVAAADARDAFDEGAHRAAACARTAAVAPRPTPMATSDRVMMARPVRRSRSSARSTRSRMRLSSAARSTRSSRPMVDSSWRSSSWRRHLPGPGPAFSVGQRGEDGLDRAAVGGVLRLQLAEADLQIVDEGHLAGRARR